MRERSETRIIYMGTPDFAVGPLKELIDAGYKIVGVITAPDKPAGRGLKLSHSAVKEFALDKNLKILQPEKLKNPDFLEELKELKPHIAVVVAFRMLPREVWSIPALGTFNLHASLLPQYRGAAPIHHAVMNGEEKTGVTTFLIDEKIDTGMILLQEEVPIDETINTGELHDLLMKKGSDLVVKTCDGLRENKIKPKAQGEIEHEKLRAAPKLFRQDARIDWSRPVIEIYNKVRGLSPYPGAYTELMINGVSKGEMKIFKTRYSNGLAGMNPGEAKVKPEGGFIIAGIDGWLEPLEIQLSGKKRMQADELLRGLRLTEQRFSFK